MAVLVHSCAVIYRKFLLIVNVCGSVGKTMMRFFAGRLAALHKNHQLKYRDLCLPRADLDLDHL